MHSLVGHLFIPQPIGFPFAVPCKSNRQFTRSHTQSANTNCTTCCDTQCMGCYDLPIDLPIASHGGSPVAAPAEGQGISTMQFNRLCSIGPCLLHCLLHSIVFSPIGAPVAVPAEAPIDLHSPLQPIEHPIVQPSVSNRQCKRLHPGFRDTNCITYWDA